MRTVVTSASGNSVNLAELQNFAGLLKYLSLRDVLVRYKQTWMGFAWSVVRPLINIAIFGTISYLIDPSGSFSGRFLEVSAAVIFWQLVSTATTEVSNSLTANSNILTKVYFPKLILPLSALLVSLLDFFIAFVIFMVLLILFRGAPPWQILLVPVAAAYAILFSFGLGLIAATASVRYRDVKFILPFLMQILFYASPIVMSSTFVLSKNLPGWMETVYQLNPLVFMVNAFKFCVFGAFDPVDPVYAAVSVLITLAMLLVAVSYFSKFERSFADYI